MKTSANNNNSKKTESAETMMLPNGLKWNQAELSSFHPLNDNLLSILAIENDGTHRPLGTGFIIEPFQEGAIACTAGHIFRELIRIQEPYQWHHPTALREFLPKAKILDLDRERVRAIHAQSDSVEAAVIGWVACDEVSDVAFFSVIPQTRSNTQRFQSCFGIDHLVPEIGEEIVILGYEGMAIANEIIYGPRAAKFNFGRRLLVRGGRVTSVQPDGFLLCRGPCIETSIPVFPGMSGGPVLRRGNGGEPMLVLGLVSSDPSGELSKKLDRSVSGSSIVPLIGSMIQQTEAGQQREIMLHLNSGFWALNEEELRRVIPEWTKSL